PETAAALGRCGGFFFTGGDPRALSEAFTADGAGTPALAAVRARVERDGVMFSGSSAGAMIAGDLTLCECSAKSSVAALTEGHLFQAPGFGLLDGVLIDAHFFARGLLGRHLYALAGNRIPVGVGIDEGTAVMVPRGGGPWEVLGNGAVALIRTPARPRVDRLSGFTLSLLAPGDIFDPQSGVVSVAPERRPLDVRSGARPLVFQDAFAPQRVREMIERLARSGADEASASVPGAPIRVVLRRTAATRVYSDGRRSTVLDLAVSIDRPAG
ncbi:MAG: hypothetical protein IRY94_18715, partial [Rhodospirillaceae bacterium]|nr:hypothetical protein [Rhodospirillaceae bacterium]